MPEFFEDLRQSLNDRLNSPFVGAYFFSWLAYNYKVVIFAFSDLPPFEKGSVIDDLVFGGVYGVWQSFGIPFLAACFYVFIVPWPSRVALLFNLWMNNLNKAMKLRIEGEKPLSKDDVEKMRAGYNSAISERDELLARRDEQIGRMRMAAEKHEENLLKAKSESDDFLARIEDLKAECIELRRAASAVDTERVSEVQRNVQAQSDIERLREEVVRLHQLNNSEVDFVKTYNEARDKA